MRRRPVVVKEDVEYITRAKWRATLSLGVTDQSCGIM